MPTNGTSGGERFPRRFRIRRRRDFQHVFQHGRRISSPEFRLAFCPNDLGHPRLGLAVSRAVGNAVRRNRVKRRIREVFRRHQDQLPDSMDLVVMPNRGVASLPFEVFREALLGLLGRAQNRPASPAREKERTE